MSNRPHWKRHGHAGGYGAAGAKSVDAVCVSGLFFCKSIDRFPVSAYFPVSGGMAYFEGVREHAAGSGFMRMRPALPDSGRSGRSQGVCIGVNGKKIIKYHFNSLRRAFD